MRESYIVEGVVTQGSKNSRVLLSRVSDGYKATTLYENSDIPVRGSTQAVEEDKTRAATEREVRVVGLRNAGKTNSHKKAGTSASIKPVSTSLPPVPPSGPAGVHIGTGSVDFSPDLSDPEAVSLETAPSVGDVLPDLAATAPVPPVAPAPKFDIL